MAKNYMHIPSYEDVMGEDVVLNHFGRDTYKKKTTNDTTTFVAKEMKRIGTKP